MTIGMSEPDIDPRITWVVAHMQRHLAEPLPVGRLAGLVNLSESRFRSLFTRQTQLAPAQYLQRLRLRRARLLLARTFLSVKEVMALVGYNDPSHFARDFRRQHGAPPTSFRDEGLTTSLPKSADSSMDPPTHRRIRPSRARDPGPLRAYG
jgi:transcriptional regulator GlxA family with amidase domain